LDEPSHIGSKNYLCPKKNSSIGPTSKCDTADHDGAAAKKEVLKYAKVFSMIRPF